MPPSKGGYKAIKYVQSAVIEVTHCPGTKDLKLLCPRRHSSVRTGSTEASSSAVEDKGPDFSNGEVRLKPWAASNYSR